MINQYNLEKVRILIEEIQRKERDISSLKTGSFGMVLGGTRNDIYLTDEHKKQIKDAIIRLLEEEISELYKEFEKII